MLDDSKPPVDSAERVKAFRTRLAGSSYRRVEAYITAAEKSQLEDIKSTLGVTTDVAVAGLLRMGIEAFESSCNAKTPPVALRSAVCGQIGSASGAVNTFTAQAQSLGQFSQDTLVDHSSDTRANSSEEAVASFLRLDHRSDLVINPIARFFKSRKDVNHDQ